ncbi:MAG: hypothetical protein P8R42_17710 [Candidatus Binatia bacterium]|nr:hypothetical protein [Candidatus Binatia bacterium]
MRILASALLALVLGCGGGLGVGGTGSSGFDEQFVISSVLDEGECRDGDGTEYCPTNVDDPSGDGETVDADVPDQEPVDCTGTVASVFANEEGNVMVDGAVSAGACGFDVPVMPEGFEDGVTIRIAVKVTGGDENWQISDVVYSGTDPEFTAEVVVDPPADVTPDGEFDVQVALLTFDLGAGEPPAEVETLAESGATTVYVTPDVTVVTDPVPTPGASPTATPAPTPTPAPTDEPEATPTPAATDEPPRTTPTPARTIVPSTPTPARTVGPVTPTPGRTLTPATPARTIAPPRVTDAPATPRPTDAPRPTEDRKPTRTPDVRPAPPVIVDSTPRPVPTVPSDVEPTAKPTAKPEPTLSPRPVFTDPKSTPRGDDQTPPRVSTN